MQVPLFLVSKIQIVLDGPKMDQAAAYTHIASVEPKMLDHPAFPASVIKS